MGHYYAGRGNQFWEVLYKVGLTSRKLEPLEDHTLPEFGIGLTDLAKGVSGMDKHIPDDAFVPTRLLEVAREWSPRAVAFNGKNSAQIALSVRDRLPIGRYEALNFDDVAVWILPSTSGAARGHFKLNAWQQFADWIKRREN